MNIHTPETAHPEAGFLGAGAPKLSVLGVSVVPCNHYFDTSTSTLLNEPPLVPSTFSSTADFTEERILVTVHKNIEREKYQS